MVGCVCVLLYPQKASVPIADHASTKAGRLVGFADCYAVLVLADNATFLLAENRIASYRSHMCNVIISCCGSIGRASAPES